MKAIVYCSLLLGGCSGSSSSVATALKLKVLERVQPIHEPTSVPTADNSQLFAYIYNVHKPMIEVVPSIATDLGSAAGWSKDERDKGTIFSKSGSFERIIVTSGKEGPDGMLIKDPAWSNIIIHSNEAPR